MIQLLIGGIVCGTLSGGPIYFLARGTAGHRVIATGGNPQPHGHHRKPWEIGPRSSYGVAESRRTSYWSLLCRICTRGMDCLSRRPKQGGCFPRSGEQPPPRLARKVAKSGRAVITRGVRPGKHHSEGGDNANDKSDRSGLWGVGGEVFFTVPVSVHGPTTSVGGLNKYILGNRPVTAVFCTASGLSLFEF